jgi:xanthine phosphoribosyltransferase
MMQTTERRQQITMEALKQKILAEGQNLGRGILKVDNFINHQIDTELMFGIGQELARPFIDADVTKVITAEISGIAPALATANVLRVPVIYARKIRPITMTGLVYVEIARSRTKGNDVFLMVASEFLEPSDRILVVDDFLASGATIAALARLVKHAGATVVGIAAPIEKGFEKGRKELACFNVPVISLVNILDMSEGKIVIE